MAKGYMFYDDEYANNEQRICSVSYILRDFDGNQIGEPVSELIDPESDFYWACTKKHGLTADRVSGCQNFKSFCDNSGFLELLSEYIFVAHNACGADLHHIKKSLSAYGLEMPQVEYVDTMAMSSNYLNIGSLKDACAHYEIKLDKHHDSFEDALACMRIFDCMANEFDVMEPVIWEPGVGSYSKGKRPKKISEDGLGFVCRSDKSIGNLLEEVERLGLRGKPEDIELVEGYKLVVTGIVPGYVGDSIEKALEAIGLNPSGSVGKGTQLLVVGNNAGPSKINKAKEQRIPFITVHELLEMISA